MSLAMKDIGYYDRVPLTGGLPSDEDEIEIPEVLMAPRAPPKKTWGQKLRDAFHPLNNLRELVSPPGISNSSCCRCIGTGTDGSNNNGSSGSGSNSSSSNTTNTKSSGVQLHFLDVVRSVAVNWVIMFHTWVFLWGKAVDSELGASLAMRVVRSGEFSVDTFFVLSGFLMAHILIREHERTGTLSVWRFYLRRWLRIFPAMAFVLAIYWPAFTALGCPNCNACNQYGWMNLLFINNYAPTIGGCMQWTWSVAVEMQFYLFAPLVMWVYLRRARAGFILLAVLLVLSLAGRGVALGVTELYRAGSDTGTFMDTIFSKAYYRVGPFLFGLLTACLWSYVHDGIEHMRLTWTHVVGRWLALAGAWLVIGALILWGEGYSGARSDLTLFFYWWLLRHAYGCAVALIIFCVLMAQSMPVASAVARAWQRGTDWLFECRVWYIMAQLSYSAFLVHPIFITVFYLAVPESWPIGFWQFVLLFAVNVLGSNVMALVVYLAIEKPIMNLR